MDRAWELSLVLDGATIRWRIFELQPGTSSLLELGSEGPHT